MSEEGDTVDGKGTLSFIDNQAMFSQSNHYMVKCFIALATPYSHQAAAATT